MGSNAGKATRRRVGLAWLVNSQPKLELFPDDSCLMIHHPEREQFQNCISYIFNKWKNSLETINLN